MDPQGIANYLCKSASGLSAEGLSVQNYTLNIFAATIVALNKSSLGGVKETALILNSAAAAAS